MFLFHLDENQFSAKGLARLGHELVHVGQCRQGATLLSFLWSYRWGYGRNIKYERPAYAMKDIIESDLTPAFAGCGP